MTKCNVFSRSAFLALSLCATMQTTAFNFSTILKNPTILSITSSLTDKKTVAMILGAHLLLAIICPIAEDDKSEDIISVYRREVIGALEKLNDEVIKEKREDGSTSAVSGKKVVRKASGIGILYKHVFNVLEKLAALAKNINDINTLAKNTNDPATLTGLMI